MRKRPQMLMVAFIVAFLVLAACERSPGEATIVARRVERINSDSLAADLYRSVSIALSKVGTIYVAVPDQHTVAVYDTAGRLLSEIGSAGQGPGEFVTPVQVGVLGDGRLVVFDAATARLSCFDADGHFLNSVQLKDSPWVACSDTLVFVVPGARPNLFEVFGRSLHLIAKGGDDSFVAPQHRTGFSLMASARGDTLWILYAGAQRPLLGMWLLNGTLLGQEEVWPTSMARNVAVKEARMKAAVREGTLPSGGAWQHLTGLAVDRLGRAWLSYLSISEDDSLKAIFYVYDSSLHLLCRVTGFVGSAYSPVFDPNDRLWVIETPSKWRGGEGETAIGIYEIGQLFGDQGEWLERRYRGR